jgi:hypothetical protein
MTFLSNMISGNQMRDSLRKWQSAPDPSTSHNFASDRQHEGTAEWFIKDDNSGNGRVLVPYFGFMENVSFFTCDRSVILRRLWGSQRGLGKASYGSFLLKRSFLKSLRSLTSSAIINDITTLCKDGSASMAYFYFDFRDVNKQARRNLLPSLLIQLAHRSDHYCDILHRLYEAHDNGARQPNDNALVQCLKEMLTFRIKARFTLSWMPLDECPDTSDIPSAREQVLDLVKNLVGLQFPSLHICVTSRPEVDISDALGHSHLRRFLFKTKAGKRKISLTTSDLSSTLARVNL